MHKRGDVVAVGGGESHRCGRRLWMICSVVGAIYRNAVDGTVQFVEGGDLIEVVLVAGATYIQPSQMHKADIVDVGIGGGRRAGQSRLVYSPLLRLCIKGGCAVVRIEVVHPFRVCLLGTFFVLVVAYQILPPQTKDAACGRRHYRLPSCGMLEPAAEELVGIHCPYNLFTLNTVNRLKQEKPCIGLVISSVGLSINVTLGNRCAISRLPSVECWSAMMIWSAQEEQWVRKASSTQASLRTGVMTISCGLGIDIKLEKTE